VRAGRRRSAQAGRAVLVGGSNPSQGDKRRDGGGRKDDDVGRKTEPFILRGGPGWGEAGSTRWVGWGGVGVGRVGWVGCVGWCRRRSYGGMRCAAIFRWDGLG